MGGGGEEEGRKSGKERKTSIYKYLPCARPLHQLVLSLIKILTGRYFNTHFADEQVEAQRGQATWPKTQSQ